MSDLEAGVIQLKFEELDNGLLELNATELSDALRGLVEFVSESAKTGALGDQLPPTVRVRPFREGSFILEAALHWAEANPDAAGLAASAAGNVVLGIKLSLRKLNGELADYERQEDGKVKLKWTDNTAQEVSAEAFDLLNDKKRRTKWALAKILAPMSDQADTLTITGPPDAAGEPVVETATRRDYRVAVAPDPQEVSNDTEVFEAEGSLTVIDFGKNGKWRVATNRGTRAATVEDQQFLRRVNDGLALKKTDIFRFRIREESVTKVRRSTNWIIEEVLSHRPGSADDDSSPAVAATAAASTTETPTSSPD